MKLDKAIEIAKEGGAKTYRDVFSLTNIYSIRMFPYSKMKEEMSELSKDMELFAEEKGVKLSELLDTEIEEENPKMKRYLVFLFCDHYPAGGDKELHSMNDDLEAAIKEVSSNWRHIGYGTIQIWDTETCKKKHLRVDEDKYFDEEILENLMKADWVGFDEWSDWG